MTKNTICRWFDSDAEGAANFYAQTSPDSEITAVHRAPSDYPSGKAGDVLTVEFTVAGIPCMGLNGGEEVRRAFDAMMTLTRIDFAAIDAARRG